MTSCRSRHAHAPLPGRPAGPAPLHGASTAPCSRRRPPAVGFAGERVGASSPGLTPTDPADAAGFRPATACCGHRDPARCRITPWQRPILLCVRPARRSGSRCRRAAWRHPVAARRFVLVGLLLLLVGGLVWAYGAAGTCSALLGCSAPPAPSRCSALCGATMAMDGPCASIRRRTRCSSRCCWAAFFLSFPRDRAGSVTLALVFGALLALALATLGAYALSWLRRPAVHDRTPLSLPAFSLGLAARPGALAV